MTDYMTAWQCLGCGMIEAPQTCVGACEYRKAELVYAFEQEQGACRTAAASHRADVLQLTARQLARATLQEGEWEPSYRALQERRNAFW